MVGGGKQGDPNGRELARSRAAHIQDVQQNPEPEYEQVEVVVGASASVGLLISARVSSSIS